LKLAVAVQKLDYFPEAVLNLITNIGAGFTVRQTAGMDMHQLVAHVSRLFHHVVTWALLCDAFNLFVHFTLFAMSL